MWSGDGGLAYNPSVSSPRWKMATYVEAAIAVLREAKEPLHYREITKRAQKKGLIKGAQTPDATMNSAIFSNMKQLGNKSAFRKVDHGVYTLNPEFNSTPTPPGKASHTPKSLKTRKQTLFTKFIKGYDINQLSTSDGEYVYGTINKRFKFIFCPKQKMLFNTAIKKCVNRERFPALYALFDIDKKTVYVGQTDVGKQRIDTHWSSQKISFTHMAVIFDELLDSEKIRQKLEFNLSNLFDKQFKVLNKSKDVEIKPEDENTYHELYDYTERISTMLHSLIEELPEPIHESQKHWLWSMPLDSYKIMRNNGVWASEAPLANLAVKILPGDRVIFYVPERKSFASVYEFMKGWYKSTCPLWTDELASNKIIHTSQIKLRLVQEGVDTLDSVGNLKIFQNKGNRGLALRSSNGYPANNGKPIPDSDMRSIIRRLRPGSL